MNCVLNPCSQSPCGINADCSANGARAVCRCRPNYEGGSYETAAIDNCITISYSHQIHLSNATSTRVSRTPAASTPTAAPLVRERSASVDPTTSGTRSVSVAWSPAPPAPAVSMLTALLPEGHYNFDHKLTQTIFLLFSNAVCKCRPNYTGDPYTNCNFDPCSSNPCGQGAFCENNGRAAVCKCPPSHIGDPYVSCRLDPCQGDACGPNAECSRSGERALCKCFRGYIGSPYR